MRPALREAARIEDSAPAVGARCRSRYERPPGATPDAIRLPTSMKRPDWFLLGMAAAVALAWLLPQPGAKGGVLHPELVNKLGVSLIFFLHGLTLSFAALAAGTRQWRLHLLVQGATFLLFPLLG